MGAYSDRLWTAHDGLALYARDYAGESGSSHLPVICLHGLTRSSRDFEDLAPWLASTGRRVLVPDMRGRGESDWSPMPRDYRPQTYARDVLSLMDSLGIARAVFIGTSMGGIITMMLAARHRKRIAAAVLNDVGPEVAPEGIVRILSYAGKTPAIASWDDAVAYVRHINEHAFPNLPDVEWRRFAERNFREDENGRPVLNYDPAIARPLASGGGKAPAFLAWLLFRRLARVPTLVIRGATSDILSLATLRKMQARARTLRVAEVPGVGHAPMLDEKEARIALGSFLDAAP